VDVPPLLLNVDAREAPEEPDIAGKTDPAHDPPAEEEEALADAEDVTIVRFPWPIGSWIQRGDEHDYRLNLVLGAELGRDSGPLGRTLSGEEGVSDDLLPAFASDAEQGGITGLPLIFSDTLVDHDDLPDVEGMDLDRDVGLWPLFAWGGGSSPDEDYLAVFPFGGTTKGLLGKETITWWGFPYPVYAEVEDRAYRSTHVMWPFLNWVEGPRHEGFRALPFYGHYAHTDSRGNPVYERTFVAWPFLTWVRAGLNEPVPTEVFFAAPFYGRIDAPDLDVWTVLWPFFKYTEDHDRDRWGLRAPFPFFEVGGGEDFFQLDLWPLAGYKSRPGYSRHFALWPIWRAESLERGERAFSGQWLLPFFWRTRWTDAETGRDDLRLRVFPLLHYRSVGGTVDFAMLSPFWMDDPNGFERIIAPFVRLYRYHRDAAGGVEHQALFGLFSYRDLPGLPGRPAYWRLSLLFGLFQYRERGEESGLRLLWLPEITWGGDDE